MDRNANSADFNNGPLSDNGVDAGQQRDRLKTPGDIGLEPKADIAQGSKSILLSILILRLRTTPFYDITHIVEYQGRKGTHALPLFGTKRFVEWLPGFSEFIQIS